MAEVSAAIEIEAARQQVWDVVTDLERIGRWVSIHHDFPEPPPGELRRGSRFKQTLAVAATKFTVEWTATEVEEPRTLSWDGTGPGGSTARTVYTLEDDGNGGTRLTYDNRFTLPAGRVGKAASKVVARQARKQTNASLEALKRLIES